MYNIKFAKLYFIFSTLKGIDVGLSFTNPSDKHNYTVIDISILVSRSEALIDVMYIFSCNTMREPRLLQSF
jgi:hypothetical protein